MLESFILSLWQNEVITQISVDITNLPKTDDGYCCIVAMDYFSKWPESRPLKDHTTESVRKLLLFENVICRHGCIKIQIYYQGREFVNRISVELHKQAGTKQHIKGHNAICLPFSSKWPYGATESHYKRCFYQIL